jgi:hypothetical protein
MPLVGTLSLLNLYTLNTLDPAYSICVLCLNALNVSNVFANKLYKVIYRSRKYSIQYYNRHFLFSLLIY